MFARVFENILSSGSKRNENEPSTKLQIGINSDNSRNPSNWDKLYKNLSYDDWLNLGDGDPQPRTRCLGYTKAGHMLTHPLSIVLRSMQQVLAHREKGSTIGVNPADCFKIFMNVTMQY